MSSLKIWSIAGAVFTAIAGSLLHFAYDMLGGKAWAVFGSVNESTWEHLKLIFWPIVIFGLIEYAVYGRKTEGFIPIKVMSFLIGMAVIIIIFYTYTGVLGYNIPAVDILIFLIGTATAYLFAYSKLKNPGQWCTSSFAATLAVAVTAALIIIFIIFTYSPPQIAIFQDPITSEYGISQ